MIQKIKNEIEKYLECLFITENNYNNRNFITYDLKYLLDNHIGQNNIVDYKVNCNDDNNPVGQKYISIDVYILERKMYKIMNLNFIYEGNKIAALQKLRKNKLEKICGKLEM